MDTRKRKELIYRAIQIRAWAENFLPHDHSRRELLIALHKLHRLWWQDGFHYLMVVDSIKRSEKLGQENSKAMGLQYERIIHLVRKGFEDIANHSGETLSSTELNQLMYGEKGLLTKATAYGKSLQTA